MTRRELRGLTGIRGIAALAVAFYHFGAPSDGSLPLAHFAVSNGYLAVDVFFVLSGFVLAYNYGGIFGENITCHDYVVFLLKRAARVFPAYLAILLIAALKQGLGSAGSSLAARSIPDLAGNLFMLTGWGMGVRAIVGPSWSVSAELFCYLLFPGMLLFTQRRRFGAALLLVLAVASFAAVVLSGDGIKGALDVIVIDGPYCLVRAFAGICLGMLVQLLSVRFETPLVRWSNAIVLISLLGTIALWLVGAHDLVKLVVMTMLVLGMTHEGNLSAALFGNRVVHYLGEISYSIYLTHWMLVGPARRLGAHFAPYVGSGISLAIAIFFFIGATIAFSALSYVAIELKSKALLAPWISRVGRRISHSDLLGRPADS